MDAKIVKCADAGQDDWLRLRQALWPHDAREEHLKEMRDFVAEPERFAQFIAYDPVGNAVGFVEAAIRKDYVNGTQSTPVVFLEGIYVVPDSRRSGLGTALVAAVCTWARALGCSELASDAAIGNADSHAMHHTLGFEETERVVFYRKRL